MLVEYIPIAILFIVAAVITMLLIVVGMVFGPRRKSFRKMSPYESGMMPIGPGTRRMSIRFYLVAVLFILFDVEVIFFYPWAVNFRALGLFGFIEMLVFVGILLVGYVYIWKKGALEWD
ncbi:MAG: NADH-quinone oxidoreductase subunit A [Chloroflexi bacterium]|nr:NADH-quinone oxidoreductase subunit A [Chloroflexota bacterium]